MRADVVQEFTFRPKSQLREHRLHVNLDRSILLIEELLMLRYLGALLQLGFIPPCHQARHGVGRPVSLSLVNVPSFARMPL